MSHGPSHPGPCATHRAHVYYRGGVQRFGELKPLLEVTWSRTRDEISTARVVIGVEECCQLLGDLETVSMELHIDRGHTHGIWQGVITRLEYEVDKVTVHAEDLLWVAKRTVQPIPYDQSYPNLYPVLDRMHWLMHDRTYRLYGDPWNMVPHLHKVTSTDGPMTSRVYAASSMTTWEDFDLYAEDSGTDYCMVARDLYYWDIHYSWAHLPALHEHHLGEFPRVVEYGNELATRAIYTDGNGYSSLGLAPLANRQKYGNIDMVDSSWNATANSDPDVAIEAPTPEELGEWRKIATKIAAERAVPPVSIIIPANTTLLPTAPWKPEDLIPGAWFDVHVTRLCRNVVETQRLHSVTVTESADAGEKIAITAIGAPGHRVEISEP